MRKKALVDKPLTAEQFRELKACVASPFEFAKHIKVIHPLRGKVEFKLYPFQRSILYYFLIKRFNIILKFRQAGVTELISLFCLWLAMYHPNKNIVILSIKDRVAKKVLRKIKFMYKNLPEHLRVRIVNGKSDADFGTAQEMEFANGSIISSIPTTEEAGRSEALSLLVIDEAAIIRWANQIWGAAFPTLSTGGAAIVNSTPYGVGNWYHSTWVDACAGGNPFNAIRLRWTMHPERDINWYNEQRQILGPRRTAQEIDGDFLTSGNSVFDLMDIRAIEESLGDVEVLETAMNGCLKIFKEPIPGYRYWLAADVATGRSRDYSTFTILDRYGEEYGAFKKKIPTSRFADLLMKVGKKYNYAEIAPETNDIGLAVTNKIQDAGYRNLYYTKALTREKGEKRPKEEKLPGWYTTKKNRPVMIDQLEVDIRTDAINIKDEFFVQEAYTFVYDETNRPAAMGKGKKGNAAEEELDDQVYNDDSIMAKAIGNFVRKGKYSTIVVAPI